MREEDTSVKNLKVLCADIVQKAKSGHPGAPLGLSQFIHILYTEYLRLNPDEPRWCERDIFILSNGHACVIQYIMNHLLGFLSLNDLKSFRQLNSNTPGHPERNDLGIEISTGPLGQGVAASVGFAISSKVMKIENTVYCVFGDGCYQEGVSQEAFSLCSRLKLDNIVFIYDYNSTTIDGNTSLSMNESVVDRFKSLDFEVIEIQDDKDQIRWALDQKCTKPKMIILHTLIGKDSELEGDSKSHGSPLGVDNVKKLKEKLGMPLVDFYFSEDLIKCYETARDRMRKSIVERKAHLKKDKHSIQAWYDTEYIPENLATRTHFTKALNQLKTTAKFITGCADLTPSINPRLENAVDTNPGIVSENMYIRYGIREHAMFGIMNGIASHGHFFPIGGTFLNFATYGMAAIRLACLDRHKLLYVFTHDSIGLGEDGPTHQPIEVLSTLRALPNLTTFRPFSGFETRKAVEMAVKNDTGPSALILSRQVIDEMNIYNDKNRNEYGTCENGAYFACKAHDHQIILIATGSEIPLAFEARSLLKEYRISIVSMLSFEIFDRQSEEYRRNIIDNHAVRISIEAMSTFGWHKYSNFQIGLDEFGRSAPSKDVFEFFGFTGQQVAERIRECMNSVSETAKTYQ